MRFEISHIYSTFLLTFFRIYIIIYRKGCDVVTNKKSFDIEIFKNPGSEYRSKPFWAWNSVLDEKELHRQIEIFKEMGFGGFHMHSRVGLATEYMGNDFMNLISSCVKKAKEEEMLACLYDEYRWPSGFCGGKVSSHKEFARRSLLFTSGKREKDVLEKEEAIKKGLDYFIACFDISLNSDGYLEKYRKIGEDEEAEGQKWYVYSYCERPSPWFCFQAYADLMNKKAMDFFIECTYEKYKEIVGDEFGKTVPDIFTDEPCPAPCGRKEKSDDLNDTLVPWTIDFDDTFYKKYKYHIVDYLPEIIWEIKDGYSFKRYCYHSHIAERFAEAFSDNIGSWCEKNNIALTGHFNGEDSLTSQINIAGIDVMRGYRAFQYPGIDVLCDYYQNVMALKQLQSAAHQYGRNHVMAELYGVTGWDYSFKGHKRQGDNLAVLGITERVHHLSWFSMKGNAKRDYPATINYQSPWYKEYSVIEDHFARLNTVLMRGKPVCDVGIIHNIESMWLTYGPIDLTKKTNMDLEGNIINMPNKLMLNNIDFEYICESTLPETYCETKENFKVGEMEYKTVIVPACLTLRKTTVDCLEKFSRNGGHIIFMGDCPEYIDGKKSGYAAELYNKSEKCEINFECLKNAVIGRKTVSIKNYKNETTGHFIYNLRRDNDEYYLFIANAEKNTEYIPYGDEKCHHTVEIKGEFYPEILNTFTGENEKVPFEIKNGYTFITYDFYEATSLLLNLKPYSGEPSIEAKKLIIGEEIPLCGSLTYDTEEENVCVLDTARWRIGGEEMHEKEELLRLNAIVKKKFDIPEANHATLYIAAAKKAEHSVELEFEFNSEIDIDKLCFASEELLSISVNGKEYDIEADGYFVDKAILKHPIGNIVKGKNKIRAVMPVSEYLTLEWCYLLGDFDVKIDKTELTLTKKSDAISFGNIVPQGKPFYSGNITYNTNFTLQNDASILVTIKKFRGYLVKVFIDGVDRGIIAFDPYNLKIDNLNKGEHTVSFKLFGTRNNTFGALHMVHDEEWMCDRIYHTTGDNWSYEYNLKDAGIIEKPVINIIGE